MGLKEEDVQRKIIHQNVKRARADSEEEIAYTEFDGFEIVTVHIFEQKKRLWFDEHIKETFKTFKWYGKCGVELLEEYPSMRKALVGHRKWCQKEAQQC